MASLACVLLCASSPEFRSTSSPSRYSGSGPSKLIRRYSSTGTSARVLMLLFQPHEKQKKPDLAAPDRAGYLRYAHLIFRRLAERDNGSESPQFDPSREVSISSAGLPPTVPA